VPALEFFTIKIMSELDKFDNEAVIEVAQEDWEMAVGSELIKTTGLGPCAGVLVYNHREKKALLGHFVNPDESRLFAGFVEEMHSEMGEVIDQKAYLAGVAPVDQSKEAQKEALYIRHRLEDLIARLGLPEGAILVSWNDENEMASIYVDVEVGNVIIRKKSLIDFEEA
jgi:hypothetical protein